MSKPANFDVKQSLEVIWEALHAFREDCISEGDQQWDDICTAMAWITEALGETKTYNHAYTLGFEISGSKTEDGSDVTPTATERGSAIPDQELGSEKRVARRRGRSVRHL